MRFPANRKAAAKVIYEHMGLGKRGGVRRRAVSGVPETREISPPPLPAPSGRGRQSVRRFNDVRGLCSITTIGNATIAQRAGAIKQLLNISGIAAGGRLLRREYSVSPRCRASTVRAPASRAEPRRRKASSARRIYRSAPHRISVCSLRASAEPHQRTHALLQ